MTVNQFFKFSMLSAFTICMASNAECMRRGFSFSEKKQPTVGLKIKVKDLCEKVLCNPEPGYQKKGAYINEYEALSKRFEEEKNNLESEDIKTIASRFSTIKETLKILE